MPLHSCWPECIVPSLVGLPGTSAAKIEEQKGHKVFIWSLEQICFYFSNDSVKELISSYIHRTDKGANIYLYAFVPNSCVCQCEKKKMLSTKASMAVAFLIEMSRGELHGVVSFLATVS